MSHNEPFEFPLVRTDRDLLNSLLNRAVVLEKSHTAIEREDGTFSISPLEKLQAELHRAAELIRVRLLTGSVN